MNRTKYRVLDVTPVERSRDRIATFERTRGWFFKQVDTFQIRGSDHDEWFYYPEADEIPPDLHDHLVGLIDDHTSENSHAHHLEFSKKQRLAQWEAEGQRKKK